MTPIRVVKCVVAALGIVVALIAPRMAQCDEAVATSPESRPILPFHFVENVGQWADDVRFGLLRGPIAARFTDDAIRLDCGSSTRRHSVHLRFEGASREARVHGEAKQPGVYNFIKGANPSNWKTSAPAFGQLLYDDLYSGVDVRVRKGALGLAAC